MLSPESSCYFSHFKGEGEGLDMLSHLTEFVHLVVGAGFEPKTLRLYAVSTTCHLISGLSTASEGMWVGMRWAVLARRECT